MQSVKQHGAFMASQCLTSEIAACCVQFGPVSHVDFSQQYPHHFAITASTRVSNCTAGSINAFPFQQKLHAAHFTSHTRASGSQAAGCMHALPCTCIATALQQMCRRRLVCLDPCLAQHDAVLDTGSHDVSHGASPCRSSCMTGAAGRCAAHLAASRTPPTAATCAVMASSWWREARTA